MNYEKIRDALVAYRVRNGNIAYVTSALKTEAPLTPELLERVHSPSSLIYLNHLMRLAIESAQRVDKLKKWLFYGKKSTENEYLDIGEMEDDYIIPPETSERLQGDVICMVHAAIGFTTESGEILEALRDHIFGGMKLDNINLIEEGGDLFWYMAIYADALRVTFDDIKERNIRKLKARYGDKFSEDAAITRNLDAEATELSHSNYESEAQIQSGFTPAMIELAKKRDLTEGIEDDSELLNQLLGILQREVGKTGISESSVEVLERIIRERDAIKRMPDLIKDLLIQTLNIGNDGYYSSAFLTPIADAMRFIYNSGAQWVESFEDSGGRNCRIKFKE